MHPTLYQLAIMAKWNIATSEQLDELFTQVVKIAYAVVGDAVRKGSLPARERDDIAMTAAGNVWKKLPDWQEKEPGESTFSTFVGVITKTAIAKAKEKYKKQRLSELASLEFIPDKLSEMDSLLIEQIKHTNKK